jgi:hypothetical protein
VNETPDGFDVLGRDLEIVTPGDGEDRDRDPSERWGRLVIEELAQPASPNAHAWIRITSSELARICASRLRCVLAGSLRISFISVRTALNSRATSTRCVLARQQHAPQDPSPPASLGRVRQTGLEHTSQVPQEVGELGIIKPHARHLIARPVAQNINVAAGEIAVEVTEERRDERHECLAMLVETHHGELVEADPRGGSAQNVGTFHCAADAPLGDDGEHAGVDETGYVAIQAGGRHVGKLGPKVGGRERTVPEERLHDPQPDGMQE